MTWRDSDETSAYCAAGKVSPHSENLQHRGFPHTIASTTVHTLRHFTEKKKTKMPAQYQALAFSFPDRHISAAVTGDAIGNGAAMADEALTR